MDFLYHSSLEQPNDDIIATFICAIRKKLRAENNGINHIETRVGLGYVLSSKPSNDDPSFSFANASDSKKETLQNSVTPMSLDNN